MPLPGMWQSAPIALQTRCPADQCDSQRNGPDLYDEGPQNRSCVRAGLTVCAGSRTGDIASLEGNPPYWRIVGRASVDIIKSGGYKISAPQIEDAILAHPGIAECAVMGAPDDALGEAVAAVIACKSEQASPSAAGVWQRYFRSSLKALSACWLHGATSEAQGLGALQQECL